jgi:hypothetical protein
MSARHVGRRRTPAPARSLGLHSTTSSSPPKLERISFHAFVYSSRWITCCEVDDSLALATVGLLTDHSRERKQLYCYALHRTTALLQETYHGKNFKGWIRPSSGRSESMQVSHIAHPRSPSHLLTSTKVRYDPRNQQTHGICPPESTASCRLTMGSCTTAACCHYPLEQETSLAIRHDLLSPALASAPNHDIRRRWSW